MENNLAGRRINVLTTVADLGNLVIAYKSIQSSRGLLTPAVDQETISGISYKRLAQISSSLKDGSFRFAPMRRVRSGQARLLLLWGTSHFTEI